MSRICAACRTGRLPKPAEPVSEAVMPRQFIRRVADQPDEEAGGLLAVGAGARSLRERVRAPVVDNKPNAAGLRDRPEFKGPIGALPQPIFSASSFRPLRRRC